MNSSSEKIKILKEVHHPVFDLYLRSDGILVRQSRDNAVWSLKDAHEFVAAIHTLTNGVPHPLLFLPGKHSDFRDKARSYLASAEALKDITAVGAVLKNLHHRIVGNLYLMVDKPVKPFRIFENTNTAIEWLKQMPAAA